MYVRAVRLLTRSLLLFPGQQLLNAFSKIVVKRIAAGQRITVEVDGLEEYQVHTYGACQGARAINACAPDFLPNLFFG